MAQKVPKARKSVEPQPRAVSREEARQLYDEMARELFAMSGDEWVRRYDAGEYDAVFDTPDVLTMVMMLPMYRDEPVRGDR